jgi:hypothetical protein
MHSCHIAKLEEKGWKVGDTVDFLGLSKEEEAYIELKILLAEYLQEKRSERHLTQNQVALGTKMGTEV